MRRHIVYALGLALVLPCAGAWANDAQSNDNAAGAGVGQQAPANPTTPAAPDQSAPNAGQPNPAPANPPPDQAQPNPAPVNPAPPDQTQPNAAPQNPNQANPAQPNPTPSDQPAPNPAQPNPAPPSSDQQNLVPPNGTQQTQPPSNTPGTMGTTTTPAYSSPLQEFMSRQLDEVGALSQALTQFQAAKRSDAVMALYHMIRDHRLLADAAANILARRGESAQPIFAMQPIPNSPEETVRQQLQEHQQTASNLQQLIDNASSPEEKRIYQRALNATNQHLAWLQALDQNQKVAVGFFGPTTPLGDLIGTTTVASANGYPQPIVSRTAGFQQQFADNGYSNSRRRTSMHRSSRHRRYRHGRYSRYSRYRRTSSYR